MRGLAVAIGWGAVGLAGCGEDEPTYAPLGEVCGAAEPFRVLELAPDQRLSDQYRPLRVDDRIFYEVARRDPADGDDSFPRYLDSSVWTTGPCGESPVEVAKHAGGIFMLDRWPGVVLACDQESGDVVSLDPMGAAPPHPVFVDGAGDRPCFALRWTEHGLIYPRVLDDDFAALEFQRYPEDPRRDTAQVETLLGSFRWQRGGNDLLRNSADFALVLTADDEVVRVGLDDGAVTVVQPGVFTFDADKTGRYVIWQDIVATNDDPDRPEGQVFLRDREDSSDVLLGQTTLLNVSPPMRLDGLVRLGSRVFRLPGLEIVELPYNTLFLEVIDERRWLVQTFPDGRSTVLDIANGASTSLFPGAVTVLRRDADGAQVLQVRPCCINSTKRDEGPVWFAPYDGSSPRRQAGRATSFHYWMADGRLVTAVGIDGAWNGALVVVDTETQEELRVDDDVFAGSFAAPQAFDDDVIVYSVADGERSGVWLARPLPGR